MGGAGSLCGSPAPTLGAWSSHSLGLLGALPAVALHGMRVSQAPTAAGCAAGGDLYRRLVRAGGLMAEADVCRDVVVPLLLTLTFLHANHIVHRCVWGAVACLVCALGAFISKLSMHQSASEQPASLSQDWRIPTSSASCPGSLHRSDIKPENIMFAADSGLRLGDFGLSIDARLERPTSRVGTLDYM